MARKVRKVVPLGGSHQTHDEHYDDETGEILDPPTGTEPDDSVPSLDVVTGEVAIGEDNALGDETETSNAIGGDAEPDEPEVPEQPARRRKSSKAKPQNGDAGDSGEAA